MPIEVTEHSVRGWQAFADEAGFVPDPMILRTGEVFVNGLGGATALGKPELEVWAALQDNIAGLLEFFDLLVTRERMPLIDYHYTFDLNSVERPLGELLGGRALPVTIGYETYEAVKKGAYRSLEQIDPDRVRHFANELQELDSLRYDWQPSFLDYDGKDTWINGIDGQDEAFRRAAGFLLGGFIFSGFAQASGTDHYIQPKRSRFFLSLTGETPAAGPIGHFAEQPIFEEALGALGPTAAVARRIDGLPPVLPYILANAPDHATASDIFKLALEFPQTPDGKRFCAAAALLKADGIAAHRTSDAVASARKEALAMLKPYSELAQNDGGFHVEAAIGTEGSGIKVSKELRLPHWLRLWWNDHTPFGGMSKTFRRMWMTAESYQRLERQVRSVWARS